MGYTHYFKQEEPLNTQTWEKLTTDVKKLIQVMEASYGIKLASDDSNGIMVDGERINFNGVPEDHETFYLPKSDKQFNFCKTARKPYDLAVCAALLLAHHHAPGSYDIASDGSEVEWKDAMMVNAQVFGYGYILPPEVVGDQSEVQALEAEAAALARKTVPQPKDDGLIDIVFNKPSRYRL